jgi:uncharacterized protein YfaS (alpha-2-macroglobulin family)
LYLRDMKAAGFEAEELHSGFTTDIISYYRESRDSITNFFISWLPHGEYILTYRVRPTLPGTYHIGAAVIESMYSPDITAYTPSFRWGVVP